MTNQLNKDLRYLDAMRESGNDIDRYAEKLMSLDLKSADYEDVDMIMDALNMKIQVFTENSVNISRAFQDEHNANLPWAELRFVRNQISHDYEGINQEIIEMICERIDEFMTAIELILDSYDYDF